MLIRPVSIQDAQAICAIYNFYVQNTVCSFETEPVQIPEMERRIAEATQDGFPFYVGEEDGTVIGYCYLHPWKAKAAYDSTAESTIYLDSRYVGGGRGEALYRHLLSEAGERTHSVIACICLPNEPSVRLHEKLGFRQVSCFRQVGRKFGEWQDVGDWQWVRE